jgi:hypothetical protein
MFKIVFWDVLLCELIFDNYFTRQYIPEDNSEHHTRHRENMKSHIYRNCLLSKTCKQYFILALGVTLLKVLTRLCDRRAVSEKLGNSSSEKYFFAKLLLLFGGPQKQKTVSKYRGISG